MKIETTQSGDTTTATVSGRVDSVNASDFEKELANIADSGATNIILDCSGLSYISSAGLRVLLITIRKLNQAGGKLGLANVNSNIQEVLEVSGFVMLTKVFDSVAAAQKALG